MEIFNLINNAWFIGIFGGILSGIVTTWISRIIFSEKDKNEYLRKVLISNKEIVHSLRSAISDNINHESKVIISLMAATARKNDVHIGDIYTIKEVTEDLIKEVMDSSFIPSEYKKKYCENLTRHYLSYNERQFNEDELENEDENEKNQKHIRYLKRKQTLIATTTASLGTIVGLLTVLLTILISVIQKKTSSGDLISEKLPAILTKSPELIFVISAPILVLFASLILLAAKKVSIKKNNPEQSQLKEKEHNNYSAIKNIKNRISK